MNARHFTMNLQPMRHMHKYIPGIVIAGAGITEDREAAYGFAQQMFIAGTDRQQDVISKVFADNQQETDWNNQNNVAFWDALKEAAEHWHIETDNNALTFGRACFQGGKRYCLDTFTALCADVSGLPF